MSYLIFERDNFSDKLAEILVDQYWKKLQSVHFSLNYSNVMTKFTFLYSSKTDFHRLAFSSSISNSVRPPKAMKKISNLKTR